jgi:hypothetical protein
VVATLVQAGATPAATVSDLVACLVADFAESSTARATASPVREPGVLHQQVDATRRAFSRADALRSVAQAYLRATGPIVRRSVTTASSDQEPPSRVYPPNGRVRVAAPLAVSDAAVRVAIIGRLRWIKRQRASFEQQARESRREMVSGESHYYRGRRYRLQVVETDGLSRVELRGHQAVVLHVRRAWSAEDRERLLLRWYRDRLRELVPPLLAKWQGELGRRGRGVGHQAHEDQVGLV